VGAQGQRKSRAWFCNHFALTSRGRAWYVDLQACLCVCVCVCVYLTLTCRCGRANAAKVSRVVVVIISPKLLTRGRAWVMDLQACLCVCVCVCIYIHKNIYYLLASMGAQVKGMSRAWYFNSFRRNCTHVAVRGT
jgi:hypothetical protein